MFEIGFNDTITVKKPTQTGRSEGNKTLEWTTIIENQRCRKITSDRVETDQTGARILVKTDKVVVNYTGSDINEKCVATVNSANYEILRVDPAKGFGRDFISITIQARE